MPFFFVSLRSDRTKKVSNKKPFYWPRHPGTWGTVGRTVVLVAIIQQLLPLSLVLLGAPQLPCNDDKRSSSSTSELSKKNKTKKTL